MILNGFPLKMRTDRKITELLQWPPHRSL
jgi:hypothetical protein